MPLIAMADLRSDSSFESRAFRTTWEDHLQLFKKSGLVRTLECSPIDTIVYKADLYGLLRKNGVEKHLLWATMRLNDYTNPQQYAGERAIFLIPDEDQLTRIAAAVASRQKLALK